MFSIRPAVPLREVAGRVYRSVTVGVPTMRYTIHSAPFRCPQISVVREHVRSLARVTVHQGRAGEKMRLTIVQRARSEGRAIENIEELVELVHSDFSQDFEPHVLERLGSGQSWLEQFRLIAQSDVFIAVGGGALGWIWALPANGAAIELRAPGSPHWLPCSGRWDADEKEMFGGLAKLSGVHHLCLRLNNRDGTEAVAQLSDPTQMEEYKRQANVYVDLGRARTFLRQALRMVLDVPQVCS
eukprot:TRINITY_DN23483_c0_g2_i2.p1 TRINITY_DN23483_c0_g2~~TRINITY_DN23483_c0_g2_i2.p1  ORF type:complete len:242 (+),score=29.89 TRINITY_DN23483_c0_g2_i2:526-1251(+)